MTEVPVIFEHVAEQRHGILLEVLDRDVLRNEARKRVDDGAIADFLIKVCIGLVPLVGVDLEKGLHQ